jgi:hypothetical protein
MMEFSVTVGWPVMRTAQRDVRFTSIAGMD